MVKIFNHFKNEYIQWRNIHLRIAEGAQDSTGHKGYGFVILCKIWLRDQNRILQWSPNILRYATEHALCENLVILVEFTLCNARTNAAIEKLFQLVAIYKQSREKFVEWAQNEIAVVPNFHKRILFSDEAHFWLNGYVNKQNCRIWSDANPQVYVETPLHPEKLTVWCALWAGGILQKR
ncbi:hypothetical protein TNCV_799951 [Trichonephila clavipes]|nr:hypothetical protein TNCV_799951 [Trichonephila clavipes]